jgi:peptidylprolyl isomerase
MPVKAGDFIQYDYSVKVKESGETIDTTVEAMAKDSGIHHEHGEGETHYEPHFIVVGEGWVPKGLDESLVGLEPDKQTTVELPPDKAYGNRDPTKIKLVPLRKFQNENIDPAPGMQVTIDGKTAQVRAVGAGRVQVDYNHPLAGKTLIYDITVRKVIEDREERIRSLIRRRLGSALVDKFTVGFVEKSLKLEVPEEAFFLEGLQLAKRTLSADVQKFFPEIEQVEFVETYKPTKPPETAQPTTEAPQQTATAPQ